MQVKSTVKINMNRIRQLTQATVTALEQMGEALHAEVVQAQVIPRKDGTLSGENFFVDKSHSQEGKVTLVHDEPYARRLYYHPEFNFNINENPNARGGWYEDWMNKGNRADQVPQIFKDTYKKITGL